MNLRPFALALILSIATRASAQSDEQKHWAEVTHKLEATPLDDDAGQDAKLTIANIAVSHDFHVALCSDFYNDFNTSKYEYHTQIRWLYLLGAATYQIETGKTDVEGTSLYALHTVLKGYAAILKQEPNAKDKTLDDFAKQDAKSKLADIIAKKNCKSQPTP